jgi:FMN phosphatase YigB (HAD superfamily)
VALKKLVAFFPINPLVAMTHTLLITDVDDTLYSWIDYFAPCFRSMVHVLAKETRLSEDEIIEDFRQVYARRKSLEYAYSVRELHMCATMPLDEIDRLTTLAHTVFGNTRKVHLKPYKDVKRTLAWAKQSGMDVVAVTNSPIDLAIGRLKNLGLFTFFTGLAAWEGYEVPTYETNSIQLKEAHRRNENKRKNDRLLLWSLPADELKPSSSAYAKIINDLSVSKEDVCVVGDSLYKDISPAISLGLMAVHLNSHVSSPAKSRNKETLFRITHWSEDKISKIYEDKSIKATHQIDRFEQLIEYLNPPQPSLSFMHELMDVELQVSESSNNSHK